MTKFTNESARGARRAAALNKPQPLPVERSCSTNAPHVDPSVCIGPLTGELRGSIPINSPAYTGKFKRG